MVIDISSRAAFDRVEVVDGDEAKQMTPGEFLALPLAHRIRTILQGNCRFYLGGETVDRTVALGELRRLAEAG